MIQKVELKNWKSYREGEFVFDFGVNTLVGSMGSGKSSVLEAIVFGFFGDLPARRERRIALDDIIRRVPNPEETAEVNVFFKHSGDAYSVMRKVKRGKGTVKSILKKGDEVIAGPKTNDVTEKVEDVLGVDFDTFTTIIFSEQNAMDFFLSLRPSERKEKIDRLLKIDRFEDARSTVVSVKNRVKDIWKSRKEDLKSLKKEFDSGMVEKLEEAVGKKRSEIEEIDEKIDEKREILDEKKDKMEELRETKRKFEKLKKKRTKLKAKKESLEEKIEEIDVEIIQIGKLDVKNQIDELEERIEDLKSKKEKIKEAKKDKGYIKKRIKESESRIEELEKDLEKIEELEEVESKIKELEKESEKVSKTITELGSEKKRVHESLGKLATSSGECPTCGKPLDEDHRVEKMKGFKRRKQDIKKEVEELEDSKEKLGKKLGKFKKKRKNLLKLGDVDKKLEKEKERLEKFVEKSEIFDKNIKKLEDDFSDENLSEAKEKLEKLRKKLEKIELKDKLDGIGEKIEKVDESIEENGFSSEEFEKIMDKVNSIKSDVKILENDKNSIRKLLEEKNKRLQELEKKIKRIKEISGAVRKWKKVEDFLTGFKSSLKRTQQNIRKNFVGKLNSVMNDFWESIYPYSDYTGIKIDVEDDYVLRIQDSRDNWVSVDGEVSGGERHSAALTLRLGLSSVLGHEFQILMLDEPTHNLDERTVSDLSDTLREDVSGLVDQVLLITHDRSLEDSVTSYLYDVSKSDSSGLTIVEEMYSPKG